jgi:hypothetical protein
VELRIGNVDEESRDKPGKVSGPSPKESLFSSEPFDICGIIFHLDLLARGERTHFGLLRNNEIVQIEGRVVSFNLDTCSQRE